MINKEKQILSYDRVCWIRIFCNEPSILMAREKSVYIYNLKTVEFWKFLEKDVATFLKYVSMFNNHPYQRKANFFIRRQDGNILGFHKPHVIRGNHSTLLFYLCNCAHWKINKLIYSNQTGKALDLTYRARVHRSQTYIWSQILQMFLVPTKMRGFFLNDLL